jgi:pyruvate kinase
VDSAADIAAVRDACADLGKHPFVIAKIERSRALENYDAILEAADGIMIARGDLGVEIPIEEIAVVQKRLIYQANLLGKPVITATQMLESMTLNPRPTRAEATDVANAILDGTDCVMLSGESSMGKYPVEAVRMLAKIAAKTESTRPGVSVKEALTMCDTQYRVSIRDLISLNVATAVETLSPSAIVVPTRSGASARSVSRFRLPLWITAVSSQETTCQNLLFSYGVHPVHLPEHPDNWKDFARAWLRDQGLQGNLAVVTEGPSSRNPEANNRMEIIDLST